MKKQDIINEIKAEILNMTLTPGDLLSEAMLSERYGLSRTPIRDILKQLASSGYIDIYPQKGSIVSYIDLDSVEQIIYLRHVLEKEIFKDLRSVISVSGIHTLSQILKDQQALHEKDSARFMALDDLFHETCFEMAGRHFLWELIQQSIVHYARYRQLHMISPEKLASIHKEHRMLLDYLKGNQDIQLDTLIHKHIRADITSADFKEKYLDYLKS